MAARTGVRRRTTGSNHQPIDLISLLSWENFQRLILPLFAQFCFSLYLINFHHKYVHLCKETNDQKDLHIHVIISY
jgi:hypothetical protein